MPTTGAEGAEPQLSAQRRRLFIGVMLATPWALLLLVELLLRLVGYGSSSPLFVASPGHPGWMEVNPRAGERWFRGGPFVPTPEVEYFRATRPPGALRIFFQGESSAQGFPYGHGAMPSRMLERRLAATYPGRHVEVVNVAFTAVNSWTLLDQADEIVAQRPDAVLIYTGHNEYYGALGLRPRPLAKAALLVRHSRLAQLVAAGVGRVTRREPAADAPRTVMQLMAGEQRVPLGSERYQAGLRQLRANLAQLLARYREARVPVFIGTIASNEHHQPPLDGPDTPAARAYARARALEAKGDWENMRLAVAAYREARDLDALRFRAPSAINAIIREEAARHGATVVESAERLAASSPHGLIGSRLMLEHLHPNVDGYSLIADAFYDGVRRAGLGGRPDREPESRQLSPSYHFATVTPLDLIVGTLRTDRLVSGWPFQPRGRERTPIVDTLRPRTQAEQLAQDMVLGRLPWPEATERWRASTEAAGHHIMALQAAEALAQEIDWSPVPCLDAARSAMAMGDTDRVLASAQCSLAREETAAGQRMLGIALLHRGDQEAALVRLRRAVQLTPGDRRAQAVLQSAEVLPGLERRRALAPRDTSVLYEIALAYAFTEQGARAREAVAALRRLAPASPRLEALSVIERTGLK